MSIRCKNCGNEVNSEYQVCPFCGTRVEAPQAVPPTPPPMGMTPPPMGINIPPKSEKKGGMPLWAKIAIPAGAALLGILLIVGIVVIMLKVVKPMIQDHTKKPVPKTETEIAEITSEEPETETEEETVRPAVTLSEETTEGEQIKITVEETEAEEETEEETETEDENGPAEKAAEVWRGSDEYRATLILYPDGKMFYAEFGSGNPSTVKGAFGEWYYEKDDIVVEFEYDDGRHRIYKACKETDSTRLLTLVEGEKGLKEIWNDDLLTRTTMTPQEAFKEQEKDLDRVSE